MNWSGARPITLWAICAAFWLSACRSGEDEPPPPALEPAIPEDQLGIPPEYTGPIDPEWPPRHATNLATELEASRILRERLAQGEVTRITKGQATLPGATPDLYVHRDQIGGFQYIEVITGHVSHPDERLPLIVLLHGRGGKPQIPSGSFPDDIPIRFFIPQAPDPLGEGYTWLATWTESGQTQLLTRSLSARADELAPAISAFTQLRPTRGKPIVVGFSQGGILSFTLSIRHPQLFTAAFPIAGWLPPALMPDRLTPGVRYPSIHAQHGTADTIVPLAKGRETFRQLRTLGVDIHLTEIPRVGHIVTPEMNRSVRRWISQYWYTYRKKS